MEAENIAGFSYYAGYNRLTTALLFLCFVWVERPRRATWAESVLLASMLFLLLAIKITGFIAGISVVLIAALISPVKRIILIRAVVLLMLALALLQATTGLPVAYLADIRAMLAVNKGGMAYFLASTALRCLPALAAGVALFRSVLDPSCFSVSRRPQLATRRWCAALRSQRALLMVAAVFAGTLAAESQNTGSLLLAAALAVSFWSLPKRATSAAFVHASKVAVVVAILAPWWGSIAHRGVILVTREARELVSELSLGRLIPGTLATPTETHIASDLVRIWNSPMPPLSLLVGAADVEPAVLVALAQTIDEAAAAAARGGFVRPETRVMTIAGIDFFARILGARSPSGTNLWQDMERTFGRRSAEELRIYLRNVDAAFMRRCEVDPVYTRLNALFLPALQADFLQHDLTNCWSIWTRRGDSAATPGT